MKKNKGKILAVDFGENNVGLAVCDEDRQIVFGKGVIKDFGNLERLFSKIKNFSKDNNIELVVFGVPTGSDGEPTEQTLRYSGIGKRLESYLNTISVVFVDESYSTFEANQVKRNGDADAVYSDHELAAVGILNRYLNAERES